MVCFGCCLSGTMLCIFPLVLKSIYVKLRAWLMSFVRNEEWPCEYSSLVT